MREINDFDILTVPGRQGSGPDHWQTHREAAFPSVVISGRDDDRVSPERARAFASAWGSRFADAGALGHIGSAAKLGLWPQGLVLFGQLSRR